MSQASHETLISKIFVVRFEAALHTSTSSGQDEKK